MFNKCTLKNVLTAIAVMASVNAFAADDVKLANGNVVSWADVVSALNNAEDLTTLNQAITDAQNKANNVEPKTETVVDPDIQDQIDKATTFLTNYTAYKNGDDNATGSLWVSKITNREQETALTLSFTEQSGMEKMTLAEFYTAYTAKVPTYKEVVDLYLYLNAENKAYQVATYEYTAANQRNLINTAISFLSNTIPTLKSFQITKETEKYGKALQDVTDAQNALKAAQENQTNYQTITLTANVASTEAIKNYAGTIIGGGYAINAPATGAVFTKFTGSINNAAINGELADIPTGATLNSVAILNSNNAGKYYNATGVATEYGTLGELAFAVRNSFGVENGKLAKVATDNKVYSVTVYSSAVNNFDAYVTYANSIYTDVDNNSTVEVGANVFVKSATNDLNMLANNVIYNGKSNKVVITDRANFYCPEAITATSVTYDRVFKAGANSVCLPFTIKASSIAGAKFATYDSADETKFMFKYQSSDVAANTPILLIAENEGALAELSYVTIEATPSTQIVAGVADDKGNASHGLLKNADLTEINGALGADKVWGLGTDGKFNWMGATSKDLPAFRMVISTQEVGTLGAAREIAIIGEEEGDDIISSVGTVDNDGASIEVVGGNGELTITSTANYGNVVVYNVEGKVVANANVVEGTTTVNLPMGVYIVMGKKVVVK